MHYCREIHTHLQIKYTIIYNKGIHMSKWCSITHYRKCIILIMGKIVNISLHIFSATYYNVLSVLFLSIRTILWYYHQCIYTEHINYTHRALNTFCAREQTMCGIILSLIKPRTIVYI